MDENSVTLGKTDRLPEEARAVIVGGGVSGCSVAYHLAHMGWTEIVLLEQGELGGGTTWHAAGLIGRLRTSNSMTKINQYSAELYQKLEAETGQSTGWKEVGSLNLARTEERMTQLRRTAAMAEVFGVEANMIGSEEAGEKWPLIRTDDLRGAVWLPHDGKVKPRETALAMAKGAEMQGAILLENIRVIEVSKDKGRVTGVITNEGEIKTDCVVICGGMWARELGLKCGVDIPLYPVEHHYIVSESIKGVDDNLPVARDPDACIYFRSEGDSILLGAFQKYTKPWMVDQIPDDFNLKLLDPDWPKFDEPLKEGRWRIPALQSAEFPEFVNGPESFTPDNNFILGEAPELRGMFVAAGFNSAGIASAGGAGKSLAEWIIGGEAPVDLWSVDIRRFAPFHNGRSFLTNRVTEVLGLHYQLSWPNREMETGRGLKKSAIYDALADQSACFGSKMGWERPNWFALDGMKPECEYSFGQQNWHQCVASEHQATRESVAIFDQSSFSKFEFIGRDVLSILQRLCGNDLDVPTGKVVYAGMFNERGCFESDLTVVRLSETSFLIISASGQRIRDFNWVQRHIPADADAELIDLTEEVGVLGLMGPQSREVLEQVTEDDVCNEAFPFGTAQQIQIGTEQVRAIRITYVGELGWEIHVPMESMAQVYRTLMEAGESFGCINAGHYAINSLRMEKAYRAWGAELSTDETPLEAGLSFAVAWDKAIPFIGRDALLRQKESGLKKKLVQFVLEDPEPMLWANEPILRDGKTAGYTTSAAYGHTLGASVAMGYVRHDGGVDARYVREGSYEIEVDGVRMPARAYLRTPYDPDRQRILT